jgi:hypothetical protein
MGGPYGYNPPPVIVSPGYGYGYGYPQPYRQYDNGGYYRGAPEPRGYSGQPRGGPAAVAQPAPGRPPQAVPPAGGGGGRPYRRENERPNSGGPDGGPSR